MDQTRMLFGTIDCRLEKERFMAFKDILLTLTSYPEPTPVSVLGHAVSIAATFGAHLAAVSCEVHVQVPGHFLAGSIANIPGIIAGEAEKSRKSARDMLAAFDAAAAKAGVLHETFVEKCPTFEVPDLLVDYARLRDLTLVPVPESYDQWYAETVIFDLAGRPLSCRKPLARVRSNWKPWPSPGISAGPRPGRFPMHSPARTGQKGARRYGHQRKEPRYQTLRRGTGQEPGASRHRRHARQGRRKRQADRRVSRKLYRFTSSRRPRDGAYGHAKWREFILGGATKSLLSKPPLPILFSH